MSEGHPRTGHACMTCEHVLLTKGKEEIDRYTVRGLMRVKAPDEVAAQCTLSPEWVKVKKMHYCGRWERASDLWSSASANIQAFVWGTPLEREYERLGKANSELRRQLARARAISAERLSRLRRKG